MGVIKTNLEDVAFNHQLNYSVNSKSLTLACHDSTLSLTLADVSLLTFAVEAAFEYGFTADFAPFVALLVFGMVKNETNVIIVELAVSIGCYSRSTRRGFVECL